MFSFLRSPFGLSGPLRLVSIYALLSRFVLLRSPKGTKRRPLLCLKAPSGKTKRDALYITSASFSESPLGTERNRRGVLLRKKEGELLRSPLGTDAKQSGRNICPKGLRRKETHYIPAKRPPKGRKPKGSPSSLSLPTKWDKARRPLGKAKRDAKPNQRQRGPFGHI